MNENYDELHNAIAAQIRRIAHARQSERPPGLDDRRLLARNWRRLLGLDPTRADRRFLDSLFQ